ncbi:hypothetical protein D3C76_1879400 [compost metagenome]|nr:hypothetical protein [Fontibacillus solani]MBA9088812.1 hypothetical protein [Fontibacillus solani]
MPDDVLDALSTSPIKGEPGSVIYINPMTGTKVFVNPDYQEIVGIHPNSFK